MQEILSLVPTIGINAKAHRKGDNFQESYSGLAVVDGEIVEAVILRIYGTQARNYCCLWVQGNGIYSSGSGQAGGYGYHRASAAAQAAFETAGIKLKDAIDGRGDSAIKDAVEVLLKHICPTASIYYVLKANA